MVVLDRRRRLWLRYSLRRSLPPWSPPFLFNFLSLSQFQYTITCVFI
jgi:hypothetical protein